MARETEGQYVFERLASRRASRLIQLLAVAGTAACVALAALLQNPINQKRRDLELVMQSELYKELPPKYAWVSAFGGAFRGLAVHYFWHIAEELKQEGKYFQSNQLARIICTLQPRFAEVWSFQAWNMSYNISVATHTAEERWTWVYNGIRLLRDEGIPNNERVVPLYHQLAWTWFHKVGQRLDDYHNFYKRIWAATMETLLGKPPLSVGNAEAIDWFRPVAEAPETIDALLAKRPGIKALIDQLSALGIDVTVETDTQKVYHPLEEQFFKPYTAWINAESTAAIRLKPRELTPREQQLEAFFSGVDQEDFNALLACLRAKVLREQYKMDPRFMLDLTGRFGTEEPIPIDWRTPWSHSMYWAEYGTTQGMKAKNLKEFDLINTDRVFLFSLATISKVGRYMFRINLDDPMSSFLSQGPDLRYIEAMHLMYIEYGKRHAEEGEDVEGRSSEMLRDGHANNLETAIVALYLGGREDEARKYKEYLAQNYPHKDTGGVNAVYLMPMRDYVLYQMTDMPDSFEEIQRVVHQLLYGSYIALAEGRDAEHDQQVRLAGEIFREYQKEHDDVIQGRTKMLTFPQLRAQALSDFLVYAGFPAVDRSRVWNAEARNNTVRQMCYDSVIETLRRVCEQEGYDVKKAFPEPPGMGAYREAHPIPELQEDAYRDRGERRDTDENED